MRQKRILLAFIKPVDFIDKQDRTPSRIAILPRPLNRLANLFNAGGDRRNPLNIGIRITANHFGKRGFTRTGRPPEDHRMQMPGLNGAWQWFAGSE